MKKQESKIEESTCTSKPSLLTSRTWPKPRLWLLWYRNFGVLNQCCYPLTTGGPSSMCVLFVYLEICILWQLYVWCNYLLYSLYVHINIISIIHIKEYLAKYPYWSNLPKHCTIFSKIFTFWLDKVQPVYKDHPWENVKLDFVLGIYSEGQF